MYVTEQVPRCAHVEARNWYWAYSQMAVKSGTWNSAIQTAGLFWGFHLHLTRGLSCPPDIDVDSGVPNSSLEPSSLPVLRIFLFYASDAAKAL